MISIENLRVACEALHHRSGTDSLVFVVREEHLQKRLAGRSGTFFVVVLPSAEGSGRPDNTTDINTLMIMILRNQSKSEATSESELSLFSDLQKIILMIKDQILSDASCYLQPWGFLDHASIEIDPEWNVAGGYHGYSLALSFNDQV